MIAQSLGFLVLVAAALAGGDHEVYKPYENVDPNSLACDPLGHEYLLLPHFSECNKFYMCDHGVEKEFTCPAPLIFDFEQQACNWVRDTRCILRDDEEGSGSDGGDIIGAGEVDNSETVDLKSRISSAVQNFEVILNCHRAESASRQVAYKGDCQRYWKCIDGVPQSVYCTDGLFFNESKQQCDFEGNAKCADTVDELQGEFMLYK